VLIILWCRVFLKIIAISFLHYKRLRIIVITIFVRLVNKINLKRRRHWFVQFFYLPSPITPQPSIVLPLPDHIITVYTSYIDVYQTIADLPVCALCICVAVLYDDAYLTVTDSVTYRIATHVSRNDTIFNNNTQIV